MFSGLTFFSIADQKVSICNKISFANNFLERPYHFLPYCINVEDRYLWKRLAARKLILWQFLVSKNKVLAFLRRTNCSIPENTYCFTAQKMKFSIKDFFSKYMTKSAGDLVIFTEEILNGKFRFLCSNFRKFTIQKSFIQRIHQRINSFVKEIPIM